MKKTTKHLLFALLFFFCNQGYATAAEHITICGTGDSQELLRILAKKFEAGHPEVTVSVPDSVGSGGGIRAVAMGTCELGRVARPIQEKEKRYALNYHLFAWSPVVFVLHQGMTAPKNLSYKQIVSIYGGEFDKWEQVEGNKGTLYVVNREEQDSSRAILEKIIPEFKSIQSYPGRIYYSTQDALNAVKQHKQTIGYLPLSVVRESGLSILAVNDISPTAENVQAGSYELTAPFGLVWKGDLTGVGKMFFDFLRSPAAQAIMVSHGAFAANQ